ncbi:UNVERIFIED_CONTAM: hypothetical protein K2H54_016756 [Gekko kuhli]
MCGKKEQTKPQMEGRLPMVKQVSFLFWLIFCPALGLTSKQRLKDNSVLLRLLYQCGERRTNLVNRGICRLKRISRHYDGRLVIPFVGLIIQTGQLRFFPWKRRAGNDLPKTGEHWAGGEESGDAAGLFRDAAECRGVWKLPLSAQSSSRCCFYITARTHVAEEEMARVDRLTLIISSPSLGSMITDGSGKRQIDSTGLVDRKGKNMVSGCSERGADASPFVRHQWRPVFSCL